MSEVLGRGNSDYDGLRQLEIELRAAGIDTASWGEGVTKKLADFYGELSTGESLLTWDQDGAPLRVVNAFGLDVIVDNQGSVLKLVEDRQVFADGKVKRRNLSTSLGEKIPDGESLEVTAGRLLKEEIGVSAFKLSNLMFTEFNERPSASFPGLRSIISLTRATAVISPQGYNPDGYSEVKSDRTSYFIWRS